MCIQYRRCLPYWTDRFARYGNGCIYYMRVLYNVRTQWPLRSHRVRVWAANIAIEWLPSRSITEEQTLDYCLYANKTEDLVNKKKKK